MPEMKTPSIIVLIRVVSVYYLYYQPAVRLLGTPTDCGGIGAVHYADRPRDPQTHNKEDFKKRRKRHQRLLLGIPLEGSRSL
jgi:hypothetical protein